MVTITKTAGNSILRHCAPIGEYTAHIKGAPNFIMDKCTKYMDRDGNEIILDSAARKGFMNKVDELSEQALRVLAVATVKIGAKLPYEEDEDTDVKFAKLVQNCTFCGMCASIDPERDGVKEAVRAARTAGVRVVMITGDYLKTAQAIAKNINILNKHTFVEGNGEAVDCGQLRPVEDTYISNSEMDELTRKVNVFARAKPEDKLEIVKSLQRQGWVCAMTGDGVNDAPALQKADIGVAMGLEGTEVAKGASDMILTDDNFCSIVKAIEKGRTIYAGIQKFIAFIMSVHFAEVLQIFLCIVSSIPVMRQPLQILFLILVTDLPSSIALGFEPPEDLIMKRKPRPRTQPVVMMWMWRSIVANGLILTMVIFCTYIMALWAYAGAFTTHDITNPLRESCTVWKPSDWTPTLEFQCRLQSPDVARWKPCASEKHMENPNTPTKAEYLETNPDMLKYACIEKWELILAHPAYKAMEEFHWEEAKDPETPCGKVCGDPDVYPKTFKDVLEVNGRDEHKAHEAFKASLEEEMKAHFNASVTQDDNIVGLYYSYEDAGCIDCIEKSIRRARTVAFISLVWAEGFRGFCSRSFENPVWVKTFANPWMNYAMGLGQFTLIIALFIPGLNTEVLGLYVFEIQGMGWFMAVFGAVSCLFLCEVYKIIGARFFEKGELANYEEDESGIAKKT